MRMEVPIEDIEAAAHAIHDTELGENELSVHGEYASARIHTTDIEQTALSQIQDICDDPAYAGAQIEIMSDVHSGAGCVIGTTMKLARKAIDPQLVGVDIACGVLCVKLPVKLDSRDIAEMDKFIHKRIPAGVNIRESAHVYAEKWNHYGQDLICKPDVNYNRALYSIGTLGGGNHYIELDADDTGSQYLTIHSGSRNLGSQVCEYYTRRALRNNSNRKEIAAERKQLIKILKETGCKTDIPRALKEFDAAHAVTSSPVLLDSDFDDYCHDVKIVTQMAMLNREAMARDILVGIGIRNIPNNMFTTLHNYIDFNGDGEGNMVVRKGAVSAKAGETLIIPLNMRDGCLICQGIGNPDWNYSAPHGAGRKMSRTQAKKNIKLSDFVKSMNGIYSTTVKQSTIDESPMAYKDSDSIIDCITPTVKLVRRLKPIYNFKATE